MFEISTTEAFVGGVYAGGLAFFTFSGIIWYAKGRSVNSWFPVVICVLWPLVAVHMTVVFAYERWCGRVWSGHQFILREYFCEECDERGPLRDLLVQTEDGEITTLSVCADCQAKKIEEKRREAVGDA